MLCLLLLLAGGIPCGCSSPVEPQVRRAQHSAAVSCPVAEDISPCLCTTALDGLSLDMDCSRVLDEDQLETVFLANFPVSAFRRLTIYQNKNLQVLRNGALGNTSYEEIWITDGVLTEVQDMALSGSASTARTLVLNMNNLTIFPFAALSTFTELLSLDLRTNNLQGFPSITSPTLEVLYLSHNPLGNLPVDAFAGTPSIIDLHLSSAELTQILPGECRGRASNLLSSLNTHTHIQKNVYSIQVLTKQ